MPARWFVMPDGSVEDMDKVIREGLLLDLYPTPYLEECANNREWNGKPSTTQLIKGTREAFLEVTCDYAIDPDDQAFRIIGTRGHRKMELNVDEKQLAETPFSEGDITGIADHLEPDPEAAGQYILDDYKVWGSYRIARALGLVQKKRPMLDEAGEPVLYKRSGKGYTAGEPRTETYYEQDPSKADVEDAKLQLNFYRMLALQYLGVHVSRMRVFAPVRDGGIMQATSRGIVRKTYSIWIPRMTDEEVVVLFEEKRKALVAAITGYRSDIEEGVSHEDAIKENIPQACSGREAWDGRKCQGFCPVADHCVRAGGNPYVSGDGPEGEEW